MSTTCGIIFVLKANLRARVLKMLLHGITAPCVVISSHQRRINKCTGLISCSRQQALSPLLNPSSDSDVCLIVVIVWVCLRLLSKGNPKDTLQCWHGCQCLNCIGNNQWQQLCEKDQQKSSQLENNLCFSKPTSDIKYMYIKLLVLVYGKTFFSRVCFSFRLVLRGMMVCSC